MKDQKMGWEPGRPQSGTPKPRLERQRSELPRGGKDIAAQIGAELRAVFALPLGNHAFVTDEVFPPLDTWSEDNG
jgi:hypothetical protein